MAVPGEIASPGAQAGAASVLVVEDDPGIATQLVRALVRGGYQVQHVVSGAEALDRQDCDVVLLDLGLPDTDGVTVCRQLRQRSAAAIIVVTAYGEEADRVTALDAGADDYLVKPFGLSELMARIRAVLRRVRPDTDVIRHGPLAVDLRTRKVTVCGEEVALQAGGSVRVSAVAAAGLARITVSDNGVGMSAQQRHAAFRRFATGTPGGTGLGLAIVDRLVIANGGSATLSDTPGGGVTATIELSLASPQRISAGQEP